MSKLKIKETLKKPSTWLILLLFSILIGWVVEPVWKEPVTNFVEETISHKKPDLRTTITTFYFLNRESTDLVDLSKTLGYKVIRDDKGNLEIVGLDTEPGNFTTLIIDNNLIVYPNFPTMITKGTDSNKIEYCLIETLTSKGRVEANKTIPTKAWFDLENPNCENCLKHTVAVYNAGNKEIKEQRIDICAINDIHSITGNDRFWIYADKCFELRRETFLERDKIVVTFIQENPMKYTINNETIVFEGKSYNVSVWNDGQIEAIRGLNVDAWNKNQGDITQEKIWNIAVIVIPYCTPGW